MGDDSWTSDSLQRDGISEEFFHLMWLKDELNFGPSLNIPDTIIVKYGQPTSWYFTNNNGKVRKKNRQNLMNARIEEFFTKNVLGYDILATFVNIHQDPHPETGILPPSTVEFLDRDGLNAFLYNRPKEISNGILQRFIEPKGTKNGLIRAVWSPKVVLLERAENIHHLHDHRYGLYERCVTMEGPEYYYTSAPLRGPVLAGQIQKICESCVTHISEVTFAQKEVTRIVMNFKVDSRDKIWLLYTTSIRLNDMLEGTAGNATLNATGNPNRKTLVNIGAAVTIPNTINLNPSRSYDKILTKQRIRCISCAKETLDDMRHPVTYKSIIKHYEHVIHIMTEICANQHTTVLDWPPDQDIVEAAGGIGFGCIDMVPDDDALAKSSRMELSKPLEADDLRIPPILRYLHPKLTGTAYYKCRRDPLFLYKTATVCEPCFLVFAEFTTMLLRMGGDLSKLLTPDPAAVNSLQSLHEGSLSTSGKMTNGTRPSSADWRAISSVNRSTDLNGGKSKEFNPSANHRQAKNTAIGIRSQDSRKMPSIPKAVRKTGDVGPLSSQDLGGFSMTNNSINRSSSLNQLGASGSITGSLKGTHHQSFDDADVQQMVAERERNFFKEISQNPQLKDQHPLMHLISAQEKLRMVDEQSGVLMSKAAASKESVFGTRYGKQGPDKFEKFGIYKVEQPYIMKGELIKPSKYLQIKAAEKDQRMAAKMERIRRKKARQAEMAASAESPSDPMAGGSVVSEESSIQDITNTKSAKKHRNFLRDTLQGVEQEIVASQKYIKIPDKEQIKFSHEHGAFEALSEADIANRNLNPTLKEQDFVATSKVKRGVNIADTSNQTFLLESDLGAVAAGGGKQPNRTTLASSQSSRPGTDATRPGTTSVGGRNSLGPSRSAAQGFSKDEIFSDGEDSLGSSSLNSASEGELLKSWGMAKPLRAEAPAMGASDMSRDVSSAASSLRNMMASK